MGSVANHSKLDQLGLSIIFFLLILASVGRGAMAEETAKLSGQKSPPFVVTTQQNLISVKATNASLNDVIERIGQELGIAVDARIGEKDKVTTEFHDLSLEAALKHLNENYAYTTNTVGEEVSKIFLYPKGGGAQMGRATVSPTKNQTDRRAGSSESLKFEFDPSEFIEKGE